jgi:SAM-dependent methyltransferase
MKLKLYSKKNRLKNYLSFFFRETIFSQKNFLDIGCGSGILTYWAALHDATVTSLEPEFDGSTKGIQEKFIQFGHELEIPSNKVIFRKCTFQNFNSTEKYDYVLLDNSINHLDESAIVSISTNAESLQVYLDILKKIYLMLHSGGKLIFTDCSPQNFFNQINLKSPIMPTIEWHKHQRPEFWKKQLLLIGFSNVKIHWSSPNILGSLGQKILGNRFFSYFIFSHFRVEATKN